MVKFTIWRQNQLNLQTRRSSFHNLRLIEWNCILEKGVELILMAIIFTATIQILSLNLGHNLDSTNKIANLIQFCSPMKYNDFHEI